MNRIWVLKLFPDFVPFYYSSLLKYSSSHPERFSNGALGYEVLFDAHCFLVVNVYLHACFHLLVYFILVFFFGILNQWKYLGLYESCLFCRFYVEPVKRKQRRRFTMFHVKDILDSVVRLMRRPQISSKVCIKLI